jgi:LacI family transcriptional regulator
MKDVASTAGVSLKTVSRFVNGEPNIDPELAQRIAQAIEKLGYRRNLNAASLRPGWTSKMVGLIIGDLANPYYSSLARAIEVRLSHEGYMLIVSSSEEDGGRHDRILDRLMEQRVDGLIVVPPRRMERAWSEIPPPLPPLVFVDRPGDHPQADTVIADNAGGASAAVGALCREGSRSIAFIGDLPDIYTVWERYRGYCSALAEHGLDPAAQPIVADAHTQEDACDRVLKLLSAGTADALFTVNNRLSLGALQAFQIFGSSLPMIGFDDFDAAQLARPELSVVSQDVESMGAYAADLLLRRIGGENGMGETKVLPTKLILRGSEHRAADV